MTNEPTVLDTLAAHRIELPSWAFGNSGTRADQRIVLARTAGWLDGDLDDLRSLVRTSQPVRRYEPRHQSTPVLG